MADRDPVVAVVKRNLRLARGRMQLTQREAAASSGVSLSVIEKYESADNARIPNTRQLFRLAEAYSVSIDFLLGRTGMIDMPRSAPRARATWNG